MIFLFILAVAVVALLLLLFGAAIGTVLVLFVGLWRDMWTDHKRSKLRGRSHRR